MGAYACEQLEQVRICEKCGHEIHAVRVVLGGVEKVVFPRCVCETEAEERWCREREEEERRRRIERLFPTWALGKRFQECTFESFILRPGTEKALKAAREFAAGFPPADGLGLLFIGVQGNGKSHLAAAIVHEVTAKGYTAVFASVPELLSRFRATYDDEAQETEAQLMFGLRHAALMVLDDIGVGKLTEWKLEKLYEIVDGRYRDRRPTVITTNLSPAELEEQVGARAYDRLLEMCRMVPNRGTSYRREVAAQRMREG